MSSPKISKMNEFEFISGVLRKFAHLTPKNALGIGDDCAVLPSLQNSGDRLLVTTDLLVEDIHFIRAKSKAQDIGYKALAVNLSDIAAMGGRPLAFFLSLALPKTLDKNWAAHFLKGLHQCAREFHVPLLGGDTTGSKKSIAINICVLGSANAKRIKLRSQAKVGDVVCVTGFLGDSAAGLQLIRGKSSLSSRDQAPLLRAHFKPKPHLEEGVWLANQSAVHAMMDVSDGIHSDLPHILKASNCGGKVSFEKLPLSGALVRYCKSTKQNAIPLALMGGEDYCLLCTIKGSNVDQISREFERRFGRPLYRIGEITSRPGKLEYFHNGEKVTPSGHSFRHFG